jgi:predicted HicB family RNase H-like nuclease
MNLRLAAETFAQIDAACAARPGAVSRNTWIAEAVQEKLARERRTSAQRAGGGRALG